MLCTKASDTQRSGKGWSTLQNFAKITRKLKHLILNWVLKIIFSTFSEFVKSGCRFSSIRRLYSLGSRESRQALAAITSPHDSNYTALGISRHCHERSCRRGLSSTNEGKDKTGKGSGNQWSCPKCGNPCTSVERKSTIIFYCKLRGFTSVLSDVIMYQIFLLAHKWAKHVTWLNIPQLNLGNIRDYNSSNLFARARLV